MEDYVYLKIPAEDWLLLEETLVCDMNSLAFDRDLRKRIKAAYDNIEELESPQSLATEGD